MSRSGRQYHNERVDGSFSKIAISRPTASGATEPVDEAKRRLVPRGCTVSTLSMTLCSPNPRAQYRSFILPNPFPADTQLKGRSPVTYYAAWRSSSLLASPSVYPVIRHLLVADQKNGHKRSDLDPEIYRRITANGAAFPDRVRSHLPSGWSVQWATRPSQASVFSSYVIHPFLRASLCRPRVSFSSFALKSRPQLQVVQTQMTHPPPLR